MRKRLVVVLAVTGLLVAGCAGDSGPKTAAPGRSSPEPAPECVDLTGSPTAEIKMLDNKFEPDCFSVAGDQSLSIRNEGAALHNFSVEGSDIDLDVQSGEQTNTEAIGEILQPGNYKIMCKYHAPAMVAQLKVVRP